LNVLKDFFGRSDTTLTKVTLDECAFGTTEDTSQLLAAFHTNRTISDVEIFYIFALQGAALGNSLSGLLQNMSKLQNLDCHCRQLDVEGVLRAFQPALRANRTLKQLHLGRCELADDGIHLIADALVGNTTMEVLNIRDNNITFAGLDGILRIIESMPRLKMITFWQSGLGIFNDPETTQQFVSTLQQKKSSVQELPLLRPYHFPGDKDRYIPTFASIQNSLNNVALILVPLPPPPPPPPPPLQRRRRQQQHATSSMMLKISHRAVTKFAAVPNKNAGASAIFKLFTARPQLLKTRLQRLTTTTGAVTAAAVSHKQQHKHRRLL
jgi:Leucine Rich repeat